jgi:hypothetical protein
LISQLASYGILWWLTFAAVAFCLARFGRLWGVIAGHVLIAIIVTALDLQWIQAEMHRPGWNGQPDQDFVFMIGVLVRIVLINTFLLPASVAGWLSRRTAAS